MKKSHLAWSWTLIITFFILSIVNIYFGVLGFVCMILPLYHSLKGDGKIHCSHYCPRGSFLMKFLRKISFNNPLPKFMKHKYFKHVLLGFMITMLTITMILSKGDLHKIAFSMFRFMLASTIVSIIMGVFFTPRSWCQVCPMGHTTGMISKKRKKVKVEK